MKATYTPPQSVADNAQMALDVRAENPPSQQGMTLVGLARANQLANRKPVSIDTIQRMVSYFERHEIDKQGETWDEQGKGWQAWNGWGGDEGRQWANRILEENAMEMKASRRHSESDMKLIRKLRYTIKSAGDILVDLGDDGMDDDAIAGSADQTMDAKSIKAEHISEGLSQRQISLYDTYESIVETYGLFNQGIGSDGAHYMGADENPFSQQGMACGNCIFYLENKCTIVEGSIEAGGLCKLWIIPESALTIDQTDDEIDDETAALEDRNATPAEREEMSDEDFIIPETRNFPVVTPDDIPAAVSSWGRYEGDITFEEFKSRLIALAQSKGPEFVAALPEEWLAELEDEAKSIRDLARRILFGR